MRLPRLEKLQQQLNRFSARAPEIWKDRKQRRKFCIFAIVSVFFIFSVMSSNSEQEKIRMLKEAPRGRTIEMFTVPARPTKESDRKTRAGSIVPALVRVSTEGELLSYRTLNQENIPEIEKALLCLELSSLKVDGDSKEGVILVFANISDSKTKCPGKKSSEGGT